MGGFVNLIAAETKARVFEILRGKVYQCVCWRGGVDGNSMVRWWLW